MNNNQHYKSTQIPKKQTGYLDFIKRFVNKISLGKKLLAIYIIICLFIISAISIGDLTLHEYQSKHEAIQKLLATEQILFEHFRALKMSENRFKDYQITPSTTNLSALKAQLEILVDILSKYKIDNTHEQQTQYKLLIAELNESTRERVQQLNPEKLPIASLEEIHATNEYTIRALMEILKENNKLYLTILEPKQALYLSTRIRLIAIIALIISVTIIGIAFFLIWRDYVRRSIIEEELHKAVSEAKSFANGLRDMSEFGELLQSCQSVTELMTMLHSAACTVLPNMAGTIYLLGKTRQQLERIGGFGTHLVNSESDFLPDDCWAIRRNQIFPQAENQHGIYCTHIHPHERDVYTLCIPLAAQGESLGILYLDSKNMFNRNIRRLVRSVAEQLSLSLSNLQLQESLRTLSLRDPLTGLFNRRYLEASMERELSRAARRQKNMSVIIIDIDHFKRYNDTYGHDAGDAVLKQTAQLLQKQSREEDVACRFGGEEFILIMPDASSEGAVKRAEQLRDAISKLVLHFNGKELERITASFGVSTYPEHGETSDQLRIVADKALYESKRNGRNCVTIAVADKTTSPTQETQQPQATDDDCSTSINELK